ncbi:MAG: hypothetical protein ACK4YT_13805, partial [Sphingomonas sp.]
AMFVPGTPFLASTTANSLYVWHLLTGGVWWAYATPVLALAVDPFMALPGAGVAGQTGQGRLAVAVPWVGSEGAARGGSAAAATEEESEGEAAAAAAAAGGAAAAPPQPSGGSRVLLFSPHDAAPLHTWRVPDTVASLVFYPRPQQYQRQQAGAEAAAGEAGAGGVLLAITERKQLMLLPLPGEEELFTPAALAAARSQSRAPVDTPTVTAFDALFGPA